MTDDLHDQARAVGLNRLTDEHLAQLARAWEGMRQHLQRLPRDLSPADDPAHIFQAKAAGKQAKAAGK